MARDRGTKREGKCPSCGAIPPAHLLTCATLKTDKVKEERFQRRAGVIWRKRNKEEKKKGKKG